jgi:hypothetical protein
MKVTPQINADFEDYPELAPLYDAAVRRIVELMQIHDIAEMRRIRKTGVFDHQYDKDVVTAIGVPGTPNTVTAVRYAAGTALLDYLGTIGISGISLEVTQDEAKAISALWTGRQDKPNEKTTGADDADGLKPTEDKATSSLEPEKVETPQPQQTAQESQKQESDKEQK